jgi:hypothetical protein
MTFIPILWCLCTLAIVDASVTVYYQEPLGSLSASSAAATVTTGAAAFYDTTVLQPPPLPSPATTQFDIQLQSSASSVNGLSIPQTGSFFGFSVEMSVASQVRESSFFSSSLSPFPC